MLIRCGYTITYHCYRPTAMLLALNVHPSREADLRSPQTLTTTPFAAATSYHDHFGNHCMRIVAPPGQITLHADFTIEDSGQLDITAPDAPQHEVNELPPDILVFLLGSRYCETDRLAAIAWSLFADTPPGWARVAAICDFVHHHITFNYADARPTRSAWEAYEERKGVCRDFAHLAVAFCRCMNIPARYCTGYLGDIGVPIADSPMDFSAWFDVYLGHRWYTVDARHNHPRIGRILMARGRDATDVALTTSFGQADLLRFDIVTDEIG